MSRAGSAKPGFEDEPTESGLGGTQPLQARGIRAGRRVNHEGSATAEREAVAYHVGQLADHCGPRAVESAGRLRAREYLTTAIRKLGLSPEVHAFTASVPLFRQVHLLIDEGRSIPCLPVTGFPRHSHSEVRDQT